MRKKKNKNLKGFTLVEFMIAAVIALLLLGGIGIVIAENQRGWNDMFQRTYSGLTTDGIVARKTFDVIIRKAYSDNVTIDINGAWINVQYYQDSSSTQLDRYALIYVASGKLMVEYGDLINDTVLSISTVCLNVSSCKFLLTGSSVQMILNLNDGTNTLTVISSAFTHN